MMTAKRRHATPSRSLTAQINETERRLRERQRSVAVRSALLRHRIHERMTSPALLGSAAGLGFLLEQLTRRSPRFNRSLFRTAVHLMPWARPLFTALLAGVTTPVSSPSEASVYPPEPSLYSPV